MLRLLEKCFLYLKKLISCTLHSLDLRKYFVGAKFVWLVLVQNEDIYDKSAQSFVAVKLGGLFFITPTPQNISYFRNELFKVNCRIYFIGLKILGSILSAAPSNSTTVGILNNTIDDVNVSLAIKAKHLYGLFIRPALQHRDVLLLAIMTMHE